MTSAESKSCCHVAKSSCGSTSQGGNPRYSLAWGVSGLLVLWALYSVFLWVPDEKIMGAVQRIFYFHVSSAVACYCSFGIVFAASVWYLASDSWKADVLAEAAGEVGFLFCTIVLISGMIWGHAAWGTWFNWEPRLVTFLLLWLLFLSYTILRTFGDPARIAKHSAVVGILGSLTVPVMVFSIKLLAQSAQLHPQVVEKRGLAPEMEKALLLTIIAVTLFQACLVWIRTRIGYLKYQANSN
jgi:heme exporter protein C